MRNHFGHFMECQEKRNQDLDAESQRRGLFQGPGSISQAAPLTFYLERVRINPWCLKGFKGGSNNRILAPPACTRASHTLILALCHTYYRVGLPHFCSTWRYNIYSHTFSFPTECFINVIICQDRKGLTYVEASLVKRKLKNTILRIN